MLRILETHLFVPHFEDACDAILRRHREPEVGRGGFHLGTVPRDPAGPRSAALLGASVGMRHEDQCSSDAVRRVAGCARGRMSSSESALARSPQYGVPSFRKYRPRPE
jgi:hypothetical protein